MARNVGMGLVLVLALSGCISEMQTSGPPVLVGPQPYAYYYSSPRRPDYGYRYRDPGRDYRYQGYDLPRHRSEGAWVYHPRLDPRRDYDRPFAGNFGFPGRRGSGPWGRSASRYRDNGRCDDPRYETSNGGRAAPGTDEYDCSRHGDGLKGRYR